MIKKKLYIEYDPSYLYTTLNQTFKVNRKTIISWGGYSMIWYDGFKQYNIQNTISKKINNNIDIFIVIFRSFYGS